MNCLPKETEKKIVDFLKNNSQLTKFEAAAQLNEPIGRITYMMFVHKIQMRRKPTKYRVKKLHTRILAYVKQNTHKTATQAANELNLKNHQVRHVCKANHIYIMPGKAHTKREKPVKETGIFNVDAMSNWLVDCGPGY